MIKQSTQILKYADLSEIDYKDRYPECNVEIISEEEWLSLIHFNNEEIPLMTQENIQRRIAALRSIRDAPHFCFNWEEKDTPGFKIFFERVMSHGLNGNAGGRIYELEKYL